MNPQNPNAPPYPYPGFPPPAAAPQAAPQYPYPAPTGAAPPPYPAPGYAQPAPPQGADPSHYFASLGQAGVSGSTEPKFEADIEVECVAEDWRFKDDEYGPRVELLSSIQEVISAPAHLTGLVGAQRVYIRDLRPQPQDPSKRAGAIAAAQKELNTMLCNVLGLEWPAYQPHAAAVASALARNPKAIVGARYGVITKGTGKLSSRGNPIVQVRFRASKYGANVTPQGLLSGQPPSPTTPRATAPAVAPTTSVAPPGAGGPADTLPRWNGAGWVMFGDPAWVTLPPTPPR